MIEDNAWYIWGTLIALSIVTFLTRSFFLLLAGKFHFPPVVESALRYAPPIALGALIGPAVFLQNGQLLPLTSPSIISSIVALIAMLISRSMLITLIIGMTTYTAIRFWL